MDSGHVPPPPVRRDASMTLLREVMERPLDPGYAAAAADRAAHPDRRPSWLRRPATAVAAAVVGVLLSAAVIDLRAPTDLRGRALLDEQIRQRTAAADAAELRVDALTAEVEAVQDSAADPAASGLVDRARQLDVLAGGTAVSGPGVVVTLDDAAESPDPVGGDPRESGADLGRVQDRDLQITVNALWASGAEAVAVNGQRLTAQSAIRSAGEAILVGFRPLSPPYRVEAVGDPDTLPGAFAASAGGAYLDLVTERYDVGTSVTDAERLELPGASTPRLLWAEPPPGDAAEPEPGPLTSTPSVTEVP